MAKIMRMAYNFTTSVNHARSQSGPIRTSSFSRVQIRREMELVGKTELAHV